MTEQDRLGCLRHDLPDEVRQRLGQVASQPGAAIEEVTAWAWVESQSGRRTEALRRLDAAARHVAIGLAIPNLLVIPFGTALAIYTFWVLLNNDARAAFGWPARGTFV